MKPSLISSILCVLSSFFFLKSMCVITSVLLDINGAANKYCTLPRNSEILNAVRRRPLSMTGKDLLYLSYNWLIKLRTDFQNNNFSFKLFFINVTIFA